MATITFINTNSEVQDDQVSKQLEKVIVDRLVKRQVYKNHEIYAKATDLTVHDRNKVEHPIYDVYVRVNPNDNYGKEILSGKLDGIHSPNIDLMDVSFVGDVMLDGELLPGKYIGFTSTDTPPDYTLEACMELAFSTIDNVLLLK